jgi:hypothetical protein
MTASITCQRPISRDSQWLEASRLALAGFLSPSTHAIAPRPPSSTVCRIMDARATRPMASGFVQAVDRLIRQPASLNAPESSGG